MASRRSVWSNDAVIMLAKEFVCVADNVTILQQGRDEAGKLFNKIAEQGHYAGRTRPTNTRQGTYVATPSGLLLASINSNDPDVILAMLKYARSRWNQTPRNRRLPDEKEQSDKAGKSWAERFYPEDGLVLRVNSRDLPREIPVESRWSFAWNEDYAWFRAKEARQLVPETLAEGQSRKAPKPVIERIVRLHLVDNVRGETSPYEEKDIVTAELTSTITKVEGNIVSLKLAGKTKAEAEGVWPISGFRDMHRPGKQKRGFESKLLGKAQFDSKTGRFTSFELLAVGARHGGTQYNGRHDDLQEAPIGVAFTLAGDKPSDRVPPHAWWAYGWWRSE